MTGERDVEVDGPEDRAEHLAAVLDLPISEFVDLFGAGWREVEGEPAHDFDLDPSGGHRFPVTPWHVAGEPAQLMLRAFDHGVFVARPVGRWAGTHTLTLEPTDQEHVSRWELESVPDVVRRLVTRRRRGFRWCRYCRRPVPPEERFGDLCQGCASRWLGVVY